MLRLVLRPVLGIVTTSLLAGPTVLIITILCIQLARFFGLDDEHVGSGSLEGLLAWMAGSIIFGIWVSVPASILNAAILSLFASRGANSSVTAAAIGFLGGCAVVAVLFYMSSLPPPFTSFAVIAMWPPQQIAMVIAGTLMGLLQWLIIVRPRQQRGRA